MRLCIRERERKQNVRESFTKKYSTWKRVQENNIIYVYIIPDIAHVFHSFFIFCFLRFFLSPREVISTWSSGTGGAGIIGAVSYASLSIWLSTSETLLLMLIVPLIQGITFWFILVHPSDTNIPVTKDGIDSQEHIIEVPRKSFKDKIYMLPGLLKYMLPLGLVYFFEYFINNGLVIMRFYFFFFFFFFLIQI